MPKVDCMSLGQKDSTINQKFDHNSQWDKLEVFILRFYLSKAGEMLVRPSVHEIRSTERAFQADIWAFLAHLEAFEANMEEFRAYFWEV